MPRLIWVFAGRTCHFVGFVTMWLISEISLLQDIFMFLIKQLRGLEDPNSPTFKRYFYLLEVRVQSNLSLYPWHSCRWVYSLFLSIRMFITLFIHLWFRLCSSIRDSVPFIELLQSFITLKFLKWGISHQPLIRKHSYLDHRYPEGSAFILWLVAPGSMWCMCLWTSVHP